MLGLCPAVQSFSGLNPKDVVVIDLRKPLHVTFAASGIPLHVRTRISESFRSAGLKVKASDIVPKDTPPTSVISLARLPPDRALTSLERYQLEVAPTGIRLEGVGEEGLFRGAQTLLQMLIMAWTDRDNVSTLKPCKIRDWPSIRRRAAMFDWSHSRIPTDAHLRGSMDIFAILKINELHIHYEAREESSSPAIQEALAYVDLLAKNRYIRVIIVPGPTSGSVPPEQTWLKDTSHLFPSPTIEYQCIGHLSPEDQPTVKLHNSILLPKRIHSWEPAGITTMVCGYDGDFDFETVCRALKSVEGQFYVCPGTSTWCSISGRLENATENMIVAVRSAMAFGATGFVVHNWMDFQPPLFSFIPVLVGANLSWNASLVGGAIAEIFGPENLAQQINLFLCRHVPGLGDASLALADTCTVPRVTLVNSSVLYWSLFATESVMDHPHVKIRHTKGVLGKTKQSMFKTLKAQQFQARIDVISSIMDRFAQQFDQDENPMLFGSQFTYAARFLSFLSELWIVRIKAGLTTPLRKLPAASRFELAKKLRPTIAHYEGLMRALYRGNVVTPTRHLQAMLDQLQHGISQNFEAPREHHVQFKVPGDTPEVLAHDPHQMSLVEIVPKEETSLSSSYKEQPKAEVKKSTPWRKHEPAPKVEPKKEEPQPTLPKKDEEIVASIFKEDKMRLAHLCTDMQRFWTEYQSRKEQSGV
eukprot:c9998_g1_i2.p1 GENE.c9998_g1_i2~~c9998_g1_i2.p1  ORF type:complete len:700 (-),score=85.69 c9998_g1_i2:56-2155(-)